MRKTFCDRCGAEGWKVMYGTATRYAAFDCYIYPKGHLCKQCEKDFNDFLDGKAIPAIEDTAYLPITTDRR